MASSWRIKKELLAHKLVSLASTLPAWLIVIMFFGLLLKARPLLLSQSLGHLLFSSQWSPFKGEFGFWPFIMGTIWVTMIALVVAAPLSLLVAIFLSEYAKPKIREMARPMIDLLAGLPSVIYGVWGILIIVPLVGRFLAHLCGVSSSGYSVLAGGLVLAVMILPTITHVILEVFRVIPQAVREASLSLGATRWETVKLVVLREGAPGILAAFVLGVSRALGETMAVLMVVGNVVRVPRSFFDGGYPLPALIANNYGEMMSVPLYDSALMLAAAILFILVIIFNFLARLVLWRIERRRT
ncbi:MAG: phosphate ABC transporter permease subunit PstC [Candidatus Aminicenantes bacterium]|nr:phosphate ABC transporter permease subunit PstC [Candidatus Aminicenantes bacterium]